MPISRLKRLIPLKSYWKSKKRRIIKEVYLSSYWAKRKLQKSLKLWPLLKTKSKTKNHSSIYWTMQNSYQHLSPITSNGPTLMSHLLDANWISFPSTWQSSCVFWFLLTSHQHSPAPRTFSNRGLFQIKTAALIAKILLFHYKKLNMICSCQLVYNWARWTVTANS